MDTEVLFEAPEVYAHILALSVQFPDLAFQESDENYYRLTLADREAPIWVEYWKADKIQNGDDAWRYRLSHTTQKNSHVGPFSHPTERGCWIMAKKYFIEAGYIEAPRDNSHLTAKTAEVAALAQSTRDLCANGIPETGDLIEDRNGVIRRVCSTYGTKCQQTDALERSYYVGAYGAASYSGALGATINFDRLTLKDKKRAALFWTFLDDRAGAGRAVELWLNVSVFSFAGSFGAGKWEVE